MAGESIPAETSSSLGWIGDIAEGLKEPTIEALGWRIKSELGMETPSDPGPIQTPTNTRPVAAPVDDQNIEIGGVMLNKWALLVAGVSLAIAGALWLPRLFRR